MNALILILIGVSLSMDSLSLSIGLGTYNVGIKKSLIFSLIVGFFHFIMPLIGNFFGGYLIGHLHLNLDYLLPIILFLIAIEMLFTFNKEDYKYDFNILNMIIYAFSVSLDSMMVGVGIKVLTKMPLLASCIFAFISGHNRLHTTK